jgi:subtilisin family serine protease
MGNDGISSPLYPAANTGVIPVAALGSDGRVTAYSNGGAHLRDNGLAAPGGSVDVDPHLGIISTFPRTLVPYPGAVPGYAVWYGTSMATPFVSAVAGLMLSADPALTAAQVKQILRGSARTGCGSTTLACGAGIVDAGAAVATAAAMAPTSTPTSTPTATPTPTPTATPCAVRPGLPCPATLARPPPTLAPGWHRVLMPVGASGLGW